MMTGRERYVIECRHPDGSLDFADPQPPAVFGEKAITGISSNEMADAIFRAKPNAEMDGRSIPAWPKQIDSRWSARRKTW